MSLITKLYNLFNVYRLRKVERMHKNPGEIQFRQLKSLLKSAENTAWGKQYSYSEIQTVAEYQSLVPIQTYDDVKPYVQRMIEGEPDVLWKGSTKWFAKSSGTTSDKSKFIPVTQDSIDTCHLRGGRDVIMFFAHNVPSTRLFNGKILTLGGSHKASAFNSKAQVGDLSSIYLENVPCLAEMLRTPPTDIALIENFEEKLKRIAEISVKENVTGFLGVPSWYLVLLRYVLEYTGKKDITEIWPNLEMFAHGGINFDPYREQYKNIIPSERMHYIETYNASEGFFAIQDNLENKGMLLMLDYGVFYEFIPMGEFEKENPKVLTLDEVELGVNYAIVISTNSGLWRYVIGDTVKFTSLYPHKIIITGRTAQYINAFGEEIIVNNSDEAMRLACEKTGALITNYSAAPIFMSKEHKKGKHQWIVEFDKMPNDVDEFVDILDKELQQLNSDYEAKRFNNTTLERLDLVVAKDGLFHTWLKERGKLGGQHKVPRLANDRKYVDSLLELNDKM